VDPPAHNATHLGVAATIADTASCRAMAVVSGCSQASSSWVTTAVRDKAPHADPVEYLAICNESCRVKRTRSYLIMVLHSGLKAQSHHRVLHLCYSRDHFIGTCSPPIHHRMTREHSVAWPSASVRACTAQKPPSRGHAHA
jgi:hypothetical protein